MTAPATKPRRSGILKSIEKLPNNYSITIHTAGISSSDQQAKDRTYSLSIEKEWLIKKIDLSTLPIEGIEFVADGKGFLQGLWVPGLNAPTNGGENPGFHTGNEVKESQRPLGSSTPGGTSSFTTPQRGSSTVAGAPTLPLNPDAMKGSPESPVPPLQTGTDAHSSLEKDEARKDPAWLKHDDKEVWLRYISTLNTATAILEGLWQPDPAKPQAENIADKIEWIQTIATGLRKRYEKEGGA